MKDDTSSVPRGADAPTNPMRRAVIKIAALGVASNVSLHCPNARAQNAPGAANGDVSQPNVGDFLVSEDATDTPVPLKPADIPIRKPVLAFPYDQSKKAVRSEPRTNKVVLIRFEEAELDGPTKQKAANGVLAFSAICTHQGCEVKTWMAQQKVLMCYCHGSMFQPLDGGAVTGGPAPRALPMLPLKLEQGSLAVAGPFSSPPGAKVS